jgi:hypothetical protein
MLCSRLIARLFSSYAAVNGGRIAAYVLSTVHLWRSLGCWLSTALCCNSSNSSCGALKPYGGQECGTVVRKSAHVWSVGLAIPIEWVWGALRRCLT